MSKKKLNNLYLMVKDTNDVMKDFVWCTNDELNHYLKLGYVRLENV